MRIRVPKTRLVLSGRRLVVLCAVWVVIGAAASVAVAWACSFGTGFTPQWSLGGRDYKSWSVRVPDSWPAQPDDPRFPMSYDAAGHCVIWLQAVGDTKNGEAQRTYNVVERRIGWPLKCLVAFAAYAHDDAEVEIVNLGWMRRGVLAHFGRWQAQLALLPIAPGFAVNTLLYASLAAVVCLYGILWPWTRWRRWRTDRRWRRGGCEGCGFDLSGLTPGQPCPECGREKPWPDLSSFLHDQ